MSRKVRPASVRGRHETFSSASTVLTDVEVQSRFGVVMRRAVEQFSRDPSYLVEMANSARLIERRRRQAV